MLSSGERAAEAHPRGRRVGPDPRRRGFSEPPGGSRRRDSPVPWKWPLRKGCKGAGGPPSKESTLKVKPTSGRCTLGTAVDGAEMASHAGSAALSYHRGRRLPGRYRGAKHGRGPHRRVVSGQCTGARAGLAEGDDGSRRLTPRHPRLRKRAAGAGDRLLDRVARSGRRVFVRLQRSWHWTPPLTATCPRLRSLPAA